MKADMKLKPIIGKQCKEAKDAIDLVKAADGRLIILPASVIKGAALHESPSSIQTDTKGVVPPTAPPSDGKMGTESQFVNNDGIIFG